MYKIKDFFYKFFNPKGLISFRSMSFFFAILIFIVEALLLFFPIYYSLNHRPYIYAKSNIYTVVYYNVEADIDVSMYDNNYRIVDGKMISDEETAKVDKYSAKSGNINVYYIFDVKGYVANKLAEIKIRYKELYNDEDDNKIQTSAILIYDNINDETTMDDAITKYHNKTINDINEELEILTYVDIYDLDDPLAYVMLFEKDKVYIEFMYEGEIYNNNIYYQGFPALEGFKINEMKNMTEFSRCFINEFARGYATSASLSYLSNCVIYAIIFPLIFAFIIFMILRKRTNLKLFSEYYGILSIVSITPCLIAFVLSWFITNSAGLAYLAMISIYGLIMLYAVSFLDQNK